MDNHHFQRPETPPPSYDAATNGEKHQKCGSCLLLGKYLDVALNMGLFLFVNTKHIKTKTKHRIPGFKNWSWGSPTGKSDYWGHTSTNGHCKMMTIKCLKFSSARIIRIIDRLLGLSARMGKGRSWLGSDQDCLRACTNIQFVKYRQKYVCTKFAWEVKISNLSKLISSHEASFWFFFYRYLSLQQ